MNNDLDKLNGLNNQSTETPEPTMTPIEPTPMPTYEAPSMPEAPVQPMPTYEAPSIPEAPVQPTPTYEAPSMPETPAQPMPTYEAPSMPETPAQPMPTYEAPSMSETPAQPMPTYEAPSMSEAAPAQSPVEQANVNPMAAVENLNKEDVMEEALSHTNQYSPFEAPKQEVNKDVKRTSNKGAYILIGIIFVIMLLFIIFLPQISKLFGW